MAQVGEADRHVRGNVPGGRLPDVVAEGIDLARVRLAGAFGGVKTRMKTGHNPPRP